MVTGLAVVLADWVIIAATVAIGALLLPGRDASIELLQTLPSGRKVVVAIELVPTGLMIALVLALILARRGQSLASGRIRLAALQAHLGRHWRRQGRRRRREGAVDVAVPSEGRRRGGGARTGRVRGGWRRVGGVIGTAHPEGGGVVRHHVRRLLWVAVAAVHRRR